MFMFDYVVKQVFFFVSLSAGCGLDFHKRCAFKLPNDCSRVYRRCGPSLSLFPPGRPRSSTLSSNTGGSLEEVTVLAKDYRIHKMCRSYRFKWGKNATVNMAALSNEPPPSERTSQCLISKVSASLQLSLEVPVCYRNSPAASQSSGNLPRKTNAEVTKTAIHQLATRGWSV